MSQTVVPATAWAFLSSYNRREMASKALFHRLLPKSGFRVKRKQLKLG